MTAETKINKTRMTVMRPNGDGTYTPVEYEAECEITHDGEGNAHVNVKGMSPVRQDAVAVGQMPTVGLKVNLTN